MIKRLEALECCFATPDGYATSDPQELRQVLQQLANRLEVVSVLCRNKLGEQRLYLIFTASSGHSGDSKQYQ